MTRTLSLAFWAKRRADRTGCTLEQAFEIEELVAEEYDAERYDDDGPADDDWIAAAYERGTAHDDRGSADLEVAVFLVACLLVVAVAYATTGWLPVVLAWAVACVAVRASGGLLR